MNSPGNSAPTRPDKTALLDALRERINGELRALRDSQRAAQDGATHEETRQEDPKDTRAIEAQYVARGLAERVEELQDTLAELARMRLDSFEEDDAIALSALVGTDDGGDERIYFLVPIAGGETLSLDGTEIRTLTPASPLGRALSGRHVDDEIVLELPGRRLTATVAWVR